MKQKTLQEQYNLIKEGKGNAEVFMKAAKKQFPNFVRNAATLNETISSLKHNHIISESILGLGMVSSTKPTTPDWFKIFNENMKGDQEQNYPTEIKNLIDAFMTAKNSYNDLSKMTVDSTPSGNWRLYYDGKDTGLTYNGKLLSDKTIVDYDLEHYEGYDELNEAKEIVSAKQNGDKSYTVKYSDDTTEKIYVSNDAWDKINDKYGKLTEAKAVEKKVSKEVEELEEKNFDYKDPKNVDNIFGEEFLKGYYTEMKDPKNADKSVDELKEIVAKNLAKDRLYYVKDGQFGEKGVGYTDELPGLKASKTDKMEKVPMNEGRINLLDIVEGYSEFQRDDKGSKGVTAKNKGEQDAYGAGVKAGEKIEKKKMKKESTDSKLAEIEKNGRIATLEMQIEALDEIIESKNQRISMVTEDENLSELVDKKKMKEMQREVKELEKKKAKMESLYEKMSGKKYAKKEVVDEVDINPEADEISDEDLEAASDYFDNM